MENIGELNCVDFSDFLVKEGFHEDVVSAFTANRICGQTFIEMTDEDIKELLPVIGDRIRIRKLLKGVVPQDLPRNAEQTSQMRAATEDRVFSRSFQTDTPADVGSSEGFDFSHHSDPQWHIDFAIPELHTFSGYVREAVRTGVVSSRARREVIQVLRTYIIAHTITPSSEQHTTVCRKLIAKYPKLEDTEEKSRIATWKLSLRCAFKNFRKSYKSTEDAEETFAEPQAKRQKFLTEEESPIDDDEYEEAVEHLQQEFKNKSKGKKGKGFGFVKELMTKTRFRRHQWVSSDRPLISEVLEKFPYLSSSRWIQREFKAIANFDGEPSELMGDWPEYKQKIIELARKESVSRPFIKKLLLGLEDESFTYPEDHHDSIVLELLSRMLFPRGFGKNIFIKDFKDYNVDVDSEV